MYKYSEFDEAFVRDRVEIFRGQVARRIDGSLTEDEFKGNCIRNVTADHFAGAAADEIEDPRPTAELLRQWSTDHPEFAYLPRKFKIAITGSPNDRAVTKAHDIGRYRGVLCAPGL